MSHSAFGKQLVVISGWLTTFWQSFWHVGPKIVIRSTICFPAKTAKTQQEKDSWGTTSFLVRIFGLSALWMQPFWNQPRWKNSPHMVQVNPPQVRPSCPGGFQGIVLHLRPKREEILRANFGAKLCDGRHSLQNGVPYIHRDIRDITLHIYIYIHT